MMRLLLIFFLVCPNLTCKPKMSARKSEGENVNAPKSSATGVVAVHGGDETKLDSSSHISLAEFNFKSGIMRQVSNT